MGLGRLFGKKGQPDELAKGSRTAPATAKADDILTVGRLISAERFNANEDDLVRVVQSLVASGAELDTTDHIGWTALHWAAKHGLVRVVRALLDGGADASIRDSQGLTPIERGIGPRVPPFDGNKWSETYAALLDGGGLRGVRFIPRGSAATYLDQQIGIYFKAVHYGYVELVERYLEQGADPNQEQPRERGGFGSDNTILMSAVYGDSVEMVKGLLDRGAKPLAKNADDETAFSIAKGRGKNEYLDLMIHRTDEGPAGTA